MLVAVPIWLFILIFVGSFFFKKAFKLHEIHLFFSMAWVVIGHYMEIDDTLWTCWGIFLWLRFFKWLIEYIVSKFDPNFTTFYQMFKLKKIGRYPGQLNMKQIYPQLASDDTYSVIFNNCYNEEEKEEFLDDWDEYVLDLQSETFLNPDMKPEDIYCTFDEWYESNERWKYTSYHHLYYNMQAADYYKCFY